MANICASCNFENTDNELICKSCGAELPAPKKQKKPRIKQAQDPAVRKIITLVLGAATVLSLIVFIQYITGRQPLWVHNKQSDLRYITFSNSWEVWGTFFKNLFQFDFTNTNTVYLVFRILCHICGTFCYLALTALLGFSTYLVYAKHEKAKPFSVISGVSGLIIVILGSLLGYFLVVNTDPTQYVRALPQFTVLALIPLFAQIPLLGLMLPKKEKREKSKNNA